MEGKGVLFKRFADIDVFDLEVNSENPEEVIRLCQLLEPTFGGINLEDIKAPECFYIEQTLRKTMSIPVFHDDQHGTAIISGAALLNAVEVVGKDISKIRVVFNGAGASGIACAEHYVQLGVRRENILLCDTKGVVYEGREDNMNPYKARFAAKTDRRTLAEALKDADVFAGLSVAKCVTRGNAALHGRPSHRFRVGQSRSGNQLRRSQGGAARRHHRHRPLRLSRTRSTMFWDSPSSSAARWTCGRAPSTRP